MGAGRVCRGGPSSASPAAGAAAGRPFPRLAMSSSASSSSDPSETASTSVTKTVNDAHHFKIAGYSLSKGIRVGSSSPPRPSTRGWRWLHLAMLLRHGKVGEEKVSEVRWFLDASAVPGVPAGPPKSSATARTESFAKRAGLATNPMGRKLFEVREAKQSNLCVAADVGTAKELLELADKISHLLYSFLLLSVYLRWWRTWKKFSGIVLHLRPVSEEFHQSFMSIK